MTPKYVEVQSSLFRESGANVTDESKIDRYAKSMHRARGWGKFPAIHATLHEVSLEDFEDFVDASGDGVEHELAWSRPLDFNDIGRVYASIDDGHHRAYAASRMGIPLRVKKLKKNPGTKKITTATKKLAKLGEHLLQSSHYDGTNDFLGWGESELSGPMEERVVDAMWHVGYEQGPKALVAPIGRNIAAVLALAEVLDVENAAMQAFRAGVEDAGKWGQENPIDEEITLEDFLDGSESIPDDEVEGFLTARGLVPIEVVFANGDRVLLIDFDDDRYVLESDGSSFDAKRAEEWLSSKLMHNVGDMVEAEELPDFWQYPPQLYHATQRENYDEIMKKGLGARSRSRVGSNRWVGSSVFTSTDPEAIDAYGDLIFEIDTVGMAQDGVTPQVGLEPGIVEDMQARALAAKIGLYDYEPGVLEHGEGLAESTVIIFGAIPPQYLSTPFE